MTVEEIITLLKSQENPKNVKGMARFGINSKNTLGISVPYLRKLAKEIGQTCLPAGRNHTLAQELWDSGFHEARLLAGFIDNHKEVTQKQMDAWVSDFDSWDVCDQVCSNLFNKTAFAFGKAHIWVKDEREFVRRAGFAMMAVLAVHDKKTSDEKFLEFFPSIKKYSTDERNFVKKAVNWALRQIGKRNNNLLKHAQALAKEIREIPSPASRWIAGDALREFSKRAT
ncbi:DNA alkylation repair protein [Patescibacteria group bacterium]|nr:DNA alkylation repair protein [Patescibacteria group bacterium]MBU4098174.1 DNA alkylation repair protein [Patescibacteria group bacterium]